MKEVRRFLTAATLLFALNAAAYAGQMDTTLAPPTSPGQMDTTLAPPTSQGQVDTTVAADATAADDVVTTEMLTEVVLTAYQTMGLPF